MEQEDADTSTESITISPSLRRSGRKNKRSEKEEIEEEESFLTEVDRFPKLKDPLVRFDHCSFPTKINFFFF